MRGERALDPPARAVRGIEVRAFRHLDLHDHLIAVRRREKVETHLGGKGAAEQHHAHAHEQRRSGTSGRQRADAGAEAIHRALLRAAARPKAEAREHGRHQERVAIAHREREDRDQRNRPREVPHRPLRQEHRHEARQRGARCRSEGKGQLAHGLADRLAGIEPRIESPLHGLCDHDGVVDQEPEREHQRRDGHLMKHASGARVDREPSEGHQRHHARHHQTHAEPHEEQEHPGDDADAEQERAAELAEARLYSGRLKCHHMHAELRVRFAEPFDLRGYGDAEILSVETAPRDHAEHHRRLPIVTDALIGGLVDGAGHAGDVAEPHCRPVAKGHGQSCDLVDAVQRAFGLNRHPSSRELQ